VECQVNWVESTGTAPLEAERQPEPRTRPWGLGAELGAAQDQVPGERSEPLCAFSLLVVGRDRVYCVERVVDDGVDGLRGTRLWCQLERRDRACTCGVASIPTRALPGGIPEVEVAQDPFDLVLLVRGRERGNDLHALATRCAEAWILFPSLGDEPGPGAPAFLDEVGLFRFG